MEKMKKKRARARIKGIGGGGHLGSARAALILINAPARRRRRELMLMRARLGRTIAPTARGPAQFIPRDIRRPLVSPRVRGRAARRRLSRGCPRDANAARSYRLLAAGCRGLGWTSIGILTERVWVICWVCMGGW